jgi:hypothetical protein
MTYSAFRREGTFVTVLQLPGNPNAGAVSSDQLVTDAGQESTTFVPLRAMDNFGAGAAKT